MRDQQIALRGSLQLALCRSLALSGSLAIGSSLALSGCAGLDRNLLSEFSIPYAGREQVTSDNHAASPTASLASTSLKSISTAARPTEVQPAAGQPAAVQPAAFTAAGEPATDLVLLADEENVQGAAAAGYTLADVEAMALASNPTLAAAQSTTHKAAGLRSQVGLAPNPALGYFGQQIADRQTDQHGVFVEQEFVRGNKLQLNQQAYSFTQQAQVAENETQVYRVLTDVRVRFYEAVAAQQQLDTIRDFAKVASRGVEVAEDRQEAKEGSLIETLQARTLLSEVTLAAQQAEVAYQGAWKELAAIAGLQRPSPARLIADLNVPLQAPDWESVYSQIVAQSPEVAAAEAIACEKQALLRRQQAQPIPNITAQLGAGYDDGTEHGMLNVQVAAPLPVWNDNSGNISAAYNDYLRATQNVERLQQSIRARLARAAQDFDTALAAVRVYDEEILPQTSKSLELSESAYVAGELDFLQVLIVRQRYYESAVQLIAAKGNLAQATARIDGLLLTGGLEAPVDYTDGDGIRGDSFGGQ